MRDHTALTFSKPSPRYERPIQSPERLAREDKRQIFKGMVVGELEAGFLRYSRRKALIDYAKKIGIAEFEATLLIAEAQYHYEEIEPVHLGSDFALENVTRPDIWSVPLRLTFALAVATLADLCLIYWLYG